MSGTVSTIIIVVILVVILFFAIKNSIPHFRGEGGCCGGSGKEKLIKPAKLENVIATKVVKIEGMRCENCHRRVQNALNSIEGVSAKVNGDKAEAVVKLGREIEDSEIKKAINDLGYSVTECIRL
ncbi:MAG: heavy-metal-associated domain-containing protein [Eubacterium sp.]|nr:heavy-metal-associated domain-containing protein [Eubacterium sp.]MBR1773220.1 heavy-metal-associated domain-containing protein [Eubacterium sp.]